MSRPDSPTSKAQLARECQHLANSGAWITARRSNLHFRPPPGVQLCSAEALGRIKIDIGSVCVI